MYRGLFTVPCKMHITTDAVFLVNLYGTCISTNVYISRMSKTLSVLVKVYFSMYSSNFVVWTYGSKIKLTFPLSFVLNCCVKNNIFVLNKNMWEECKV